jgi:protein TonB
VAQRTLIIGFSLLAHLGLAIGLGEIDVQELRAATAIQIADTAKAPPPPPPEPVRAEPPPPKAEPKQVAARPAPAPTPEPPKAAQSAALDAAVPDFGLSLSGGVGGNGMALPASGGGPKAAPAPRALPPAPAVVSGCGEKLVKPKPKSVPQPVYTAEARSAGIEGKVRVELTVDQTGAVVSVRVLQGLGYGLDEAAVLAARQAQFEPALECGKPTRATFTISMRFTAS